MADVVRGRRPCDPHGSLDAAMEGTGVNAISPPRAVERCERLAALGPPPAWWRLLALLRWLRDYRAITALDISVYAEQQRALYPPTVINDMAEHTTAKLRMVPRSERK